MKDDGNFIRQPVASTSVQRASGGSRSRMLAFLLLLGAMATAIGVSRDSASQDGGDSDQTRNCVDLMRIDRTEVVDDDTVLFYMRNGTVYRNELRQSCPTLGFEERFMYRTALTQLCDIDVITVLQDVGFGFMPTASCGLGKFEPIDEQAAENLITRAEQDDESQDDTR